MRAAFVETLTELATEDERIVLLTGDLGFMALEPFREAHPDRFFNVGVAEQNLMGLATGLADSGFTPYCYSIATFASLRGFEFFRNGAVWHNLPVRIVGMGGGFEYGAAGMTHHAVEDIGAMRLLPRVTVLAPADAGQTNSVVRYAQTRRGPVYLRLGKDDRRRVRGLDGSFDPRTRPLTGAVRRGSCSPRVAWRPMPRRRSTRSPHEGSRAPSVCVASLAPPPTAHLTELIHDHPWVATVEAHVRSGALGSIVADTIADAGLAVPLLRCCVEDPLACDQLGSEAFLHEQHGLSPDALERRLAELESLVG